MNDTDKTPSTDPGWYTEQHQITGVDADVLTAVRANAERTYKTCGGHRLAEQMRRTMQMIDDELASRRPAFKRGVTYIVTDANVAPHHFGTGTRVRYQQTSRAGDRHLFIGNTPSGDRIQQWLAAEDVTER